MGGPGPLLLSSKTVFSGPLPLSHDPRTSTAAAPPKTRLNLKLPPLDIDDPNELPPMMNASNRRFFSCSAARSTASSPNRPNSFAFNPLIRTLGGCLLVYNYNLCMLYTEGLEVVVLYM